MFAFDKFAEANLDFSFQLYGFVAFSGSREPLVHFWGYRKHPPFAF